MDNQYGAEKKAKDTKKGQGAEANPSEQNEENSSNVATDTRSKDMEDDQ